ncbi:MAG TPA: DMT family transporter [Longimicrobiales bacterium]|nr:DMT family transporter [Longimicrobiales bacterium]
MATRRSPDGAPQLTPPAPPPLPWLGAALVIGAASFWATFGLFAKVLYARGFTPVELASVRASLGLAGAALVMVARPAGLRIGPRGLGFFVLYGVLGFALFETVFFAALERTTIAIAAALLYTAPAFVMLASRLLWHEPIPRWKVLALGMVLAGVLLVTGALDALRTGRAHLTGAALALGLGAGAGYALYTLFSKVAMRRYPASASLFWSFLFASLALALVAPPLEPLLRDRAALPALVGLGVVPTLIPYALYLAALRHLRASTAAMLASLEPVIAALLAAALLHEALDATRVLGIALIVSAAVVIARDATRSSPVAP